MMKYDYLIVGAGLYGAVCAQKLKEKGKKVLVIEKRNHIGGNIYTERKDNIIIHKYGAHIFHTSDLEIWNYISKHVKMIPFINSPLANYHDEIYNLPFNMNTFHKLWGVITPDEAIKKIAEEKMMDAVENPQNLEEQALNLVGRTIYEKLIKEYTQKQWGKECCDLPAFIIKRLPLRFTYDNNYFNDLYQGIPEEGYTKLIENLLEGIEVKLETDFLTNREEWLKVASKIIYTGPIDQYYDYEFGHLEYRSLHFETKKLPISNFQGNAVVNYTAKEVPYTRIIEHKHFLKNDADCSYITYEYPLSFSKDQEPYYPINDYKNNELYQKYLAKSKNDYKIIFGGRLGEYQYYDMHIIIRKALDLVKSL